jgi:plasmid stability protein
MPDILIRNVSSRAKERLRQRAKRRGKSLEADLRDTLENLAREGESRPGGKAGFGSWLVSISRPGTDLGKVLDKLRSAPLRRTGLE